MAKRGIDISEHQGNIDLASLKNQIDFVIIRAGYGQNAVDSKCKRNADLCIQLGIPFGFYWYSYALNVEGARREAMKMLDVIEPYKNKYSYGCWFDMEDADGYKGRHGMPSNQTLREMCAMFCRILEESGYYTGIYASQSWFNNQLNGPEVKSYDKWVAQWPTSGGKQTGLNTDANKRNDIHLWQFTSAGRFSGYNGNLDANYAYVDFPSLIGNSANKPSQPSTSSNTPGGSTLDLAYNVMKGVYGDGNDRKEALGTRYNEVQDFINHIYSAGIDTLVSEVKNGKYGNGEIRKVLLGSRYNEVQDKINAGQTRYYVVKSGDTLSAIGQRLGVNWKDIANKNGISAPYTIYPGQKLKY